MAAITKSVVLNAIDNVTFEERPSAPPGPHEVHYIKHGRIGEFVVTGPMILGHESAGDVVAVGSEVKSLKVGDRVALEPAGSYNQCRSLEFAATPPYNGTLCPTYNLHESFAHPIPPNMSFAAGALMEPLSVAVHCTVNRGKVRAMENVLVFGAGPIGLLSAAVAKAFGAKRVVVVDIIDSKLEFASSFAATHVFKPTKANEGETSMQAAERNAKALIEEIGDDVATVEGFDLVLECTGAPPCISMGLWATKIQGRFVQVGMGQNDVTIPLHLVNIKELSVTGSFRYGFGAYPTAISLVASGKIDVERLITHRYRFEESLDAFEAVAEGKGKNGKSRFYGHSDQGEVVRSPAAPPTSPWAAFLAAAILFLLIGLAVMTLIDDQSNEWAYAVAS
ncbi:hypothetical protein OC846_004770 [Tilletia horrida]|uniref:Enoyl reductase (ER) domain-containing protein n=1 Tax=Tilletia horrida TaxID=155126 RepID=A0AAN6JSF7_9BASI|nr:hypothetical protein OC846_004770 [Tilletia horrida]